MTPCLPLVVDLDGTLVHTDLLYEAILLVLRNKPLQALRIPLWLLEGKAVLKRKLALHAAIQPSSLPYNDALLCWLREQHRNGRRLVLCTAADECYARQVAAHLHLFEEVVASDGRTNLAGGKKADALVQRYGKAGFDYAGNAAEDLAVWRAANQAIVVNASPAVAKRVRTECSVACEFAKKRAWRLWARMLRVHQWAKNLLLFVPLFAGHQLKNRHDWLTLFLAFFSFCCCSSAVYIANDLFDLESDRQHPRKRERPFASGQMPILTGIITIPFLLLLSFLLSLYVGIIFLQVLVCYGLGTCAYSWKLKQIAIVDCLVLSFLYTSRIIAGAGAIGIYPSFWLLAFSVFIFLSLAFVKRYAEIRSCMKTRKHNISGRGYYSSDASLIQIIGVTSGFSSVVVFLFYINSDAEVIYDNPWAIWGAVPVVLFWISWMWLQAHRGNMHDDPLIFAFKDRASQICGILFVAIMYIGAVGLSW